MRDDAGTFRGVLEVSQNVSRLRGPLTDNRGERPAAGPDPVRENAYRPAQDRMPAGGIVLDEGVLRIDQVDLVLRHLPFAVGFLDRGRRLVYTSQGAEALATVTDDDLDALEGGTLGRVETFTADHDNRIRRNATVAVRDPADRHLGTLLVSQDITTIRALTGERRILDWRSPADPS